MMEIKNALNLWCKFVLDEGIMPNPIVRLFKNSDIPDRKNNYKKIAGILSDRENFGLKSQSYMNTADKDIIEVTKNAFNNDAELLEWLKKVDNILFIIKNSTDLEIEDLILGALTSFIKTCPLVKKEIKTIYLSQLTNQKTRAHKYTSPRQKAFEDFLNNHGYSAGTITAYKSGITYIGTNYTKNLWEIADYSEIISIKKQLESNSAYKKTNTDKHASLSNAFARYCDFLKEIENHT